MYALLVIEDDDDIRENICEILELANYRVVSAANGRVGLEVAKQENPDLILSDIQMPEMDGYGFLEELREDPKLAVIPFIFLTSLGDRQDLRQGMLSGANDYLTKPINREELLAAIKAQLSKKEKLDQHYQEVAQNLAQEQLEQMLYFDALTKLPNRLALRDRLDKVFCDNLSSNPIPILLIDIDRFGLINDSRGEEFGDRLLQAIAERLLDRVQDEDTICRLSGDEFAIILATCDPKAEADNVANSLLEAFSTPFIVGLTEVYVTASIGITIYPKDANSTNGIMQRANLALQAAKRQGGNCYQFFDQAQIELPLSLELQTDLHHALDNQEFELHYQPQVNIATGIMFGAESLIRWNHSDQGMISPLKFIPIAEGNGSIIEIGEWVLKTACIQTKELQTLINQNALKEKITEVPQLKVSVNISGRQFQQQDLNKRILHILEETDFDPQYLELELTESTIVHSIDSSLAKLKELKALGVKLSIDDFGTGFSSLGYIKKFPLDTLKIDRCFVQHIDTDSQNRAISKAIITMAKSLNFKTVAEGVETEGELKVLQDLGCDSIQGYYYSRPLPFARLSAFVKEDKRL
ncbi:EAL domain-containing protein [Pseudanabaena sp. FACHB-1998]|uniref:two-component system response regulator n=1 Tax=Pseudanabaena sp. FACHB-1998 TaxID=2692858 RepID=UPI001680B5E3|nr:EAL domain-containing response regulator [Pseudanabaena sp. FACHB-1998]MBD2176730.1 EAL domain-containing protein [Pseudanabaena sp. FACHB-1998]